MALFKAKEAVSLLILILLLGQIVFLLHWTQWFSVANHCFCRKPVLVTFIALFFMTKEAHPQPTVGRSFALTSVVLF